MQIRAPSLSQTRQHLLKARQPRFQVFDDLFRERVWLGEVVEIGDAFAIEPKDVEAGLANK